MKQRISIIAFFIIVLILSGLKVADNEYLAIDKKALQLPDSLTKTTQGIANYVMANFETDNEKTRAIFIWLTTNIQYDVENMFILNFYEKKEDKIKKSLETRKGICENYAILFSDICIKAGIKSFVVEGYTKQNDSVDFVPHAWCAAFVDNSWYLFDPTWASGYIHSGTFYKKINTNYFKVGPATYIKSHIPFDYLWQFLNYPVTNQEFYEGKTDQNNTKPFFSFTDSIQEFEKQNYTAQLQSTAYRIEKNGIKNSLIFDRLQYIKAELKNERKNNAINLYNTAVNDFNAGINGFNHYINYRNKQLNRKKQMLRSKP